MMFLQIVFILMVLPSFLARARAGGAPAVPAADDDGRLVPCSMLDYLRKHGSDASLEEGTRSTLKPAFWSVCQPLTSDDGNHDCVLHYGQPRLQTDPASDVDTEPPELLA
jgi:hypothetical protein